MNRSLRTVMNAESCGDRAAFAASASVGWGSRLRSQRACGRSALRIAPRSRRQRPAVLHGPITACRDPSPDVESKGIDERADPFRSSRGTLACPTEKWESPLASGAARLAGERGLDVKNLARSYGIILAKQMLELGALDLIPERIIDGICFGSAGDEPPMLMSSFESSMQKLMQESAEERESTLGAADIFLLSQMYGFLLGSTLRQSCLELNINEVTAGFRSTCAEPELPMPLTASEYDRQFMELQQVATALMREENEKSATEFFDRVNKWPGVVRIKDDSTVLALNGEFRAPPDAPRAALENTVHVVASGRLLDGRYFLVPSYSDGADAKPDVVSIPLSGVPDCLSCGLVGMAVGEFRTVFVHPQAAEGIASLFATQPFPPYAVIVFDFQVNAIHPTPQATDASTAGNASRSEPGAETAANGNTDPVASD